MNRSFNKKNKIFAINKNHLLCLLPLVLFSFYKNGLLVYKNHFLSLFSILQYMVVPVIVVVLSYVFEIYYYVGRKKEKDLSKVINSFVPFANLLCYLVTGPNNPLYITIPLIIVIDVLFKFIDNRFTINRIALFKCLLFFILVLLGIYNNYNYNELYGLGSNVNLSNLFVGFRIGEIGTISNLLILISFVLLLFNKFYKKDIALSGIFTYSTLTLFLVLLKVVTFNDALVFMLDSSVLFVMVFVLTLSDASPVLKGGRILYGVLVGLLCAIFVNVFKFYEGIYFVILGLSMITPMLNKLKISVYK
jgi:hypothetical protein